MSDKNDLARLVQEHLKFSSENVTSCKWILALSPVAGRGVFATEDITPGELIFVDRPLVHGPRFSKTIQLGCTNCYYIPEKLLTCDMCYLSVCSDECKNSESHKEDCDTITKWKKIEPIESNILSRSLAPIRSLSINDESKALLQHLQANIFPQHGKEVDKLKNVFEISEEDETFMRLVCSVLDANAFEIAGRDKERKRMSFRGLFPVGSLLNHSCVPNTRHYFDEADNMHVKAADFIPKGSEIFCCYVGLFWGTPARRHHLYKTKHFMCNCNRCADPTEYGSCLAALQCFVAGCPGSLLPIEPLNACSNWTCDICLTQVRKNQIGALQSALGSLLGTLDFDDPQQIVEFLEKRLLKFIPFSNQIIVELKWRLVWLFGVKEGYHWSELSAETLESKEHLCRELLWLCERLHLARSNLVALLHYHLHCCLVERVHRNQTLHKVLLKEIQCTILEAYDILKDDITAPSDLMFRKGLALPAKS